MFRLHLFKIRSFTAGNVAGFLGALSRGGLQFMLIIWLQGIWLPRHGYSFEQTPLWAGIYMVPLTVGFLIAGPAAGILSDRYGARLFATLGMLLTALAFALLETLPVNFGYQWFAPLLLFMGLAMGLFASPNRAAIMNSLPPHERGAGAGMTTTFQNSATVLSIGIFFTRHHPRAGLLAAGPSLCRPDRARGAARSCPPDRPSAPDRRALRQLPRASTRSNSSSAPPGPCSISPPQQVAALTGHEFFPQLISTPFAQGVHYAFDFAIVCSLVAAAASWMRGGSTSTAPGRSSAKSRRAGSTRATWPCRPWTPVLALPPSAHPARDDHAASRPSLPVPAVVGRAGGGFSVPTVVLGAKRGL